MSVTDSRVRKGVLTIGGETFSCQPTAVAISPSSTAGGTTTLEVLCGDTLTDSDAGSVEATLNLTAVQDFTDAKGLVGYSWKHNGQTVEFEWQATSDAADKWHGKVTVQALEVGGEVGARLTTGAQWTITELFLPPRLGGAQVLPADTTVAITGVTGGTPGAFAPGNATLPADLAALKANSVIGDAGTVKPPTFSSTQYVTLADGTKAHYDGTVWAAGAAA